MKTIRSASNKVFKAYRRLSSKKHRDVEGKYLIEGEKLVREAFALGQQVEAVLLAETYDGLTDWVEAPIFLLTAPLFQVLRETETSQGILAVVEKPKLSREAFLQHAGVAPGNILFLDRLQDPGNLGTLLRTADAAGYVGVVTTVGTADIFSPKVVRAAAGSLFRMPVLQGQSLHQGIELLRNAGKKIVTTCPEAGEDYYRVSLTENVGLIIGNEGSGVSKELLECADVKVKIPMAGSIESLNAAVAAGILMYEAMRR